MKLKRSFFTKPQAEQPQEISRAACHPLGAAVCAGTVLLIAASAPAQNLFGTSILNDTIVEITPDGVQSTFSSGAGFSALAFNNAGDLFATTFGGYYGTGGITEFISGGGQSAFASGLHYPSALAVNSAGDVFEGDYESGTITKFSSSGSQSTFASGLIGLDEMAFNSAGDLFVSVYGNGFIVDSGSIVKFTPDGTQSTFASGINSPIGLAFNSAGNLFVADQDDGTVYEYTPGGVKSTFASGLGAASGLAFNSAGDLFVADRSENNAIYKITPDGVISTFASGTNLNGVFDLAFPTVPQRSTTIYIGNSLTVTNGGPDGIPPLVILGEYDPEGPSATSPVFFPAAGMVTQVEFYGADYNFTVYALTRVDCETIAGHQRTFRVVASQSFSNSVPTPGIQTLAVTNFGVDEGDLLAFAGIGPYYPQNPNDALHSDATYEDSTNPGSFAATPPGGPGTQFTIGVYTDPQATYEYISDYYGNQGRDYAFGVEFQPQAHHSHRHHHGQHGRGDHDHGDHHDRQSSRGDQQHDSGHTR